jgi:NTE family protein
VKVALVLGAGAAKGFAHAIPDTTLDTIFQSIGVMNAKIAAAQLPRADVVIQPKVGYIASGDFTKRHEAILEGAKAAQNALPKIQALLEEPVKK